MMRKILFVSAVIFLLFGRVVFGDTKVGVVDLNKALTESSRLANTKESIKKKFEAREKKMTKEQGKIKKNLEVFNKNAASMDDDKKKAERKKIADERQKLHKMRMDLQKEFREAQDKAMKDLWKEVESVVSDVAANKDLDLVFAKKGLVYNKKKLSITGEVTERLKKGKK